MIVSFGDRRTESLFHGETTRSVRSLPPALRRAARKKLDSVNAARELGDLAVPPGNRLEALRGDREGTFSIRVNDRWRLVFGWADGNAHDVILIDYH